MWVLGEKQCFFRLEGGGGHGGGHGQIDYTLPKVDITKAYVTTALLGHRITVSEEKGPELNDSHLIFSPFRIYSILRICNPNGLKAPARILSMA